MKGITRRNIKTYENEKLMYFESKKGWFYIEKQEFWAFLCKQKEDFYVYEPKWSIEEEIDFEMLEECKFKTNYDGYEYLSLVVTYLDKIGERTYDVGCFTSYKHCRILYDIFKNFDFREKNVKLEIYGHDYNKNEYVKEVDSTKIDIEAFLSCLYSDFFEDYMYDLERTDGVIKIYKMNSNDTDTNEEYIYDNEDKEDIYWNEIYECC